MPSQHARPCSRRGFVGGLTGAGTSGLVGVRPHACRCRAAAGDTADHAGRDSRHLHRPAVCREDLLHSEGFTDVQYVQAAAGIETAKALAAGEADISLNFVAPMLLQMDAGDPIVLLAGIHVGCFVLFGTERVRAVRDLKGKTVGVQALGSSQHVFLASMLAYVGLDANKDVTWVTYPSAESKRLLAEGKVDAFLGFPPDPQELRASKSGAWWSTAP